MKMKMKMIAYNYANSNKTMLELAKKYKVSKSTIKRSIDKFLLEYGETEKFIARKIKEKAERNKIIPIKEEIHSCELCKYCELDFNASIFFRISCMKTCHEKSKEERKRCKSTLENNRMICKYAKINKPTYQCTNTEGKYTNCLLNVRSNGDIQKTIYNYSASCGMFEKKGVRNEQK